MKAITKILCLIFCLVLCITSFAACDTGIPGEQGEKGKKGDTPTIEISDDGYWVINGEKTDVKAEASTDEDGTDGLEYYPLPDGTYAVSEGTTKYLEEIVIPKTYKGKSVTTILPDAFFSAENLKAITIPDSVTSIGDRAFYNCSSLTSIVIPDSVTSIGDYAFQNCSSLTSIEIPDSVTSIGYYAFYYCRSLTSVVIGSGVTSIGSSAFRYCSSLTDIYFTGTEAEWAAISKWDAHIPSSATIHYNYTYN